MGAAAEVSLIAIIFFLYGASFPPDVNEAHYLAKAKHYWQPAWGQGDLFLESADAHLVFYYTFGWITQFVSLSAAAWIGRGMTWLGLAWAWWWMSSAITPLRGAAALSAGLFLLFIRWCAPGGEWVVGGVEAKGFAYIFAFASLGALARGKWTVAWLAAGAAAAFHILVGGWLLVALAGAWLTSEERPGFRATLLAGLGAVLLSLPALIPALALSSGVDRETVREANRIYVYERLGHHLLFHRFDHLIVLVQVALAGAWLFLCWRFVWPAEMRRVQRVVAAALWIALAGIIIDQATLYHQDLAAALLRYYWFRMSDALLPVGMALFLVSGTARLAEVRPALSQGSLIALLLLAGLNLADVCRLRSGVHFPPGVVGPRTSNRPLFRFFGAPGVHTEDDVAPEAAVGAEQAELVRLHGEPPSPALDAIAGDWLRACAWIAENTESTEKTLTPRAQQTFKWYAQRPEAVSWKDVPQDAPGLVAWFATWNEVHPPENAAFDLCAFSDERLRELAHKYGAQYLLIDRTRSRRPIGFPRLYPEDPRARTWFEVYRILPPTNGVAPSTDESSPP